MSIADGALASALSPLPGSDGQILYGLPEDDNTFVTVVSLAQSMKIAPNPEALEVMFKSGRMARFGQPGDREAAAMYEEMQRAFAGAKRRNVEPYGQYQWEVHTNKIVGAMPVLEGWVPERLTVNAMPGGLSALTLGWDQPVVLLDGSTQFAGLHDALSRHAGDPAVRQILQKRKTMRIHYDRPVSWARQVFHDFNLLGVKPSTSVGIAMDSRNPLTALVLRLEDVIPQLHNAVNHTARQLRADEAHLVTVSSLRTAVTCLLYGRPGIQASFRVGESNPLPDDAEQLTEIWFGEFFARYAAEFTPMRRKESILPSPAALAAVSVIGHEALGQCDPTQYEDCTRAVFNSLAAVNWTRGPAWAGIAGQINPVTGTFSTVGGVKEHAGAIEVALADRRSPTYAAVRSGVPVAAAPAPARAAAPTVLPW